MKIRLGTRGSALALAQARLVAERLGHVEVVPIATSGDRADKSRFVKEIEDALLAGEIDLAVHSAKDVPAELPAGLAIVGVPARADARDALCGVGALDALADGSVIGTASLRRRAQLLALRPDLEVRSLRGNVDTRLRRLAEGDFDAIVLAHAGLERLDRADEGVPLPELVPAPGQGCLALEARAGDDEVVAAAGSLTDPDALTALTAERALVEALGATCHTPIGAHAALDTESGLLLTAFVGLPDGSHWIRDELTGEAAEPAVLGRAVAERMEAAGARELLAQAESDSGEPPSSSRATLVAAIKQRRVVELRHGRDPETRVVHPHVLYRSSEGELVVNGYQVGGFSGSGDLPAWRTFELRGLSDVAVHDETFPPAPGYEPGSPRYGREVEARV